MNIRERIYHHISLHSQADARWSYTAPPLATIPPDLRDIYKPDPGWPWVEWDWDQIETRLHAAYARDVQFLQDLNSGKDIHLMGACVIFGLPYPPVLVNPFKASENHAWFTKYNWKMEGGKPSKEDPRRHFGKTMGHRLCKGGKPENSGSIPGAKQLNLKREDLVRAANAWLGAHPAINTYHRRLEGQIGRSRETRTWYGRRRRYLGDSKHLPTEALAHPDQAGTQDIANLVILDIKRAWGEDVYYVKGMHDSQTWGVREDKVSVILPTLREIVTRPREINGVLVPFPAEFKEVKYG